MTRGNSKKILKNLGTIVSSRDIVNDGNNLPKAPVLNLMSLRSI